MMKHTLWYLGLPNYPTGSNTACAYSEKCKKHIEMMARRGHHCIHLGLEGSKVDCEHITTMSFAEQERHWGGHDHTKQYSPIVWDPNLPYWKTTNENAIYWITKRRKPDDLLCIIAGTCQKPVADAIPDMIPVEYGVGYYGIWSPFRVFESYNHMNHVYGRCDGANKTDNDGRFYDCVIPNYFNVNDFPFVEDKGLPEEPYALFIGRIISRKGVGIAVEASRRAGIKLLIAGQGVDKVEGNTIHASDGAKYSGDHIEYVGFADAEKRAKLMSNATCGFVPSMYVEPFGGVSIEMNLCGTPVITTDYGCFAETIKHGKTGYRCHRLAEFAMAVDLCKKLDRKAIREYAQSMWSLERVATMYEHYFDMVVGLNHGCDWNGLQPPENLDWLNGR